MTGLVGIGELAQPLADSVQDTVIGRIAHVQGHKMFGIELRVAQCLLEELHLRFFLAGADHYVGVRIILGSAEHVFEE